MRKRQTMTLDAHNFSPNVRFEPFLDSESWIKEPGKGDPHCLEVKFY